MSRSARYLDAFAAIERRLRRIVEDDRRLSFYQLVDAAATRAAPIRHYAIDLKEYADLRNAIVHERGGGRVIAEPYEDTVRAIESIQAVIENPPLVLDIVKRREVVTATSSEPIGTTAKRMLAGSFSQVPIYDDGRFEGLLTAESIARWLATRLEGGVGLVEEEPVRVVLGYAEFDDNYRLVPRSVTVFDAIDVFTALALQGRPLDAVIVTQHGKREERPLTIATPYDMPLLIGAARPFART